MNISQYLVFTEKVGDCFIWKRCFNSDGYPRAVIRGNSNGKVHREVCRLANPDEDIGGKVVRHTCDNIKCINPEHLVSGSVLQNVQDRVMRGRCSNKILHGEVFQTNRLRQQGFTYNQIADSLGIKPKRVEYILNNYKTEVLGG